MIKSVDEYIASQPEKVRDALEKVRNAIRKAVPKAEEVISYKMPTYKLGDALVIYFAAWKKHYSLYPASPELIAEFGDKLKPYLAEKSTLRIPYSEAVPVKLITAIAKFRAKLLRRAQGTAVE